MYNVHPFLTPWFLDNSSYSLELSIYKLSEASKPSWYLFTSHLTCLLCLADHWYFLIFLIFLNFLCWVSSSTENSLLYLKWEEIWHLAPGWSLDTCDGWCLHSAVSPTSTPPQQPSWSLPWLWWSCALLLLRCANLRHHTHQSPLVVKFHTDCQHK